MHDPRALSRLTEQVLLALLLTVIGIGCLIVILPFLSAIAWAAILVFSAWPLFEFLRQRFQIGLWVISLLLVLLSALLVVLPVAFMIPAAVDDIGLLRHDAAAWFAGGLPTAPLWLTDLPLIGPSLANEWNNWSADIRTAVNFFTPYVGIIAESGLTLLLALAGGIAQAVLALFIAFFFFLSGDSLALSGQALLHRIGGARADRLRVVVGDTVRGTLYGVLGTAIIQGLLTGLGLRIAGVPGALLLGTMAGFLSVLPVGAPVIWIPASLWLLITGHTLRGIFLLIYGTVAISGADHIVRPYFIARGARLPFLLTVLGVLGGVLSFGLLGIFLGPALLAVGFSLVAEFGRTAPDAPT